METHRQFQLRTIIYAILLVLIYWFLNYRAQEIIIDQGYAIDDIHLDPRILYIPALTLTSLFYSAEIVAHFLEGKMVQPLTSGLRRLGANLFVWLILSSPQSPDNIRSASIFFLTGSSVFIALSLISEAYSTGKYWKASIFSALKALTLGVSAGLMVMMIPEIGIVNLSIFFFLSGAIIAVIAISGIYGQHPDERLASIGRRISSGYKKKVLIVIVGVYYLLIYRAFLIQFMGQSATLLTLIEWFTACIISFRVYKNRRSRLSVSSHSIEKWGKHIQSIEFTSDKSQENWSRLIDNFIENAEKDLLYIYLIDLLRKKNVSHEIIHVLLSKLSNYIEPDETALLLIGSKQKMDEWSREERRNIITNILYQVQEGNRKKKVKRNEN